MWDHLATSKWLKNRKFKWLQGWKSDSTLSVVSWLNLTEAQRWAPLNSRHLWWPSKLSPLHLSHRKPMWTKPSSPSLLFTCHWSACCLHPGLSFSQVLHQLLQAFQVRSVQLLRHVQLFATPWTAACQAYLSITNSWSLLKLMSIESVMPSNHLIPLSPSPLTFNLSQHQGLFQWVSSSPQLAEVLEIQLHQSFQWIFRTDLL